MNARKLIFIALCSSAIAATAFGGVSPLHKTNQHAFQSVRPNLAGPLVSQFNDKLQSSIVSQVAAGGAVADSTSSGTKQTLKVGTYFGLWYLLNIGYNIYNKKALNAFAAPWTVATAQMIIGMGIFFPLWILKLRKAPKLSKEDVKTIMPVAVMHTLGHVTGVISLGAGAVSFTHIVKAGEPFFTATLSAVLLKQFFPWQVYTTLLPVCVGVGLASLKELTFNWVSFGGAMGSNLACSLRGIFSKQMMTKNPGENMTPANLYSVLTIIASVLLVPAALLFEGTKLKGLWDAAIAAGSSGNTILLHIFLSGLYYYTYNEVAFLALSQVHPVTHAVGNTIKRVVIILTSVIVFNTQMTPLGTLGSAMAIGGVLLYSLAKNYYEKK
mmetsp:Transcript_17569/g.25654  ORF Transcript_17569/g.25654 Transcript_17569/m.25654 type:complete len:383 (-) Transcript_17569:458-1606(-)|eukprot:CAMPEP_0113936602 /NCGR_PEP_ID=MMETSP1339-20121228/3477_1 /TAXON_ID=94617 /ORGANISM="Fibrocapsa japonica" /LENGTH=382 /DNA_ID=CAMNT_0000939133 /DNA_START=75 /DNA_END=1223 /DNA_ORIENTATION=- /assembly_acc=CAM_ASM_000762